MKDELLTYFMDQTDKRFEMIQGDVKAISRNLEDLRSFKAEMLVSSRWVSLIISAVCGLATMLLSAYLSFRNTHG